MYKVRRIKPPAASWMPAACKVRNSPGEAFCALVVGADCGSSSRKVTACQGMSWGEVKLRVCSTF